MSYYPYVTLLYKRNKSIIILTKVKKSFPLAPILKFICTFVPSKLFNTVFNTLRIIWF